MLPLRSHKCSQNLLYISVAQEKKQIHDCSNRTRQQKDPKANTNEQPKQNNSRRDPEGKISVLKEIDILKFECDKCGKI